MRSHNHAERQLSVDVSTPTVIIKWNRPFKILVVALLLFCAPLSCRMPSKKSAPLFVVRWGEFNKEIGNLTFFLGVEKGFFRDEGIDLRITTFSGGPPKMAAAAAGDLDMGTIGPPGVVAAFRGTPIKLISSGWTSAPYFFLISKPDIANIAALKGRRIGINNYGSGYDLAIRVILKQNGIDPVKEVSIVATGDDLTEFAAFENGDLSAVVVKEHLVSLAESKGTGKLLASSWDYMPNLHVASIFATDQFIANHPDVLRRILKAYWRSQNYAIEHEDEAIEFGSKFLEADRSVVKSAWQRLRPYLRRSGEIDQVELQNTVNLLYQFDFIDKPFETIRLLDLSYLPKPEGSSP